MSEYQKKFLMLTARKEAYVESLKDINKELDELMRQMPLGEMFQDPETNIVYQIIIPNGTFVPYKGIDYIRTRKDGETAGTLSVKAAKEAGFSPFIPGEKGNL